MRAGSGQHDYAGTWRGPPRRDTRLLASYSPERPRRRSAGASRREETGQQSQPSRGQNSRAKLGNGNGEEPSRNTAPGPAPRCCAEGRTPAQSWPHLFGARCVSIATAGLVDRQIFAVVPARVVRERAKAPAVAAVVGRQAPVAARMAMSGRHARTRLRAGRETLSGHATPAGQFSAHHETNLSYVRTVKPSPASIRARKELSLSAPLPIAPREKPPAFIREASVSIAVLSSVSIGTENTDISVCRQADISSFLFAAIWKQSRLIGLM
jgi:hypothetical protein